MKVKYQGHNFHKMAVTSALEFHKHSLYSVCVSPMSNINNLNVILKLPFNPLPHNTEF